MAIKVFKWVFDHSRSRNGERLVMLAVADACNNDDGTGAWLSNAALSAKTNLSERAVQESVRRCELLGELKVDRNAGRGGVNAFAVVMDEKVQNLRGADSAGCTDDKPADSAGGPNGGYIPGQRRKGAESAGASHESRGAESAPGTVSTKNSSSKSSTRAARKTKAPDTERADIIEISTYLADMIERLGSKRPTFGKEWLKDARLLLDEKRPVPVTVERVKAGIDWVEQHDFWPKAIRSMTKLRKHWDTIRLDATAEAKKRRAAEDRNSQPGRMTGGMKPESNAPKAVPQDEKCPRHPNYRATTCGPCRSERLTTQKAGIA